jgi:hypothetical protein
MLQILIRVVGLPALAGCAIAGLAFDNWMPMAILVMVVIVFATVSDRHTHPQRTPLRGWYRDK